MDYSILIALLRAKQYLTDLEKDILDTWDEWKKEPFDYNSAQRQVIEQCKIPRDIYCNQVPTMTVTRPLTQMTEADIRYNLENQFIALAAKEDNKSLRR